MSITVQIYIITADRNADTRIGRTKPSKEQWIQFTIDDLGVRCIHEIEHQRFP
jgi:hypothetical protein